MLTFPAAEAGLVASLVTEEYDLIGSILSAPDQWGDVTDIQPALFEHSTYRTIWGVVYDRKGQVAPAVLHNQLLKSEAGKRALDDIGGINGIHRLYRDGKTAGPADVLAEEIRRNSVRRDIEQATRRLRPEQYRDPGEWGMALASAINIAVGKLAGPTQTSLAEAVDDAVAAYEWRQANSGKIQGIKTGIAPYDKAIGGLGVGQLVDVCGHSGEGKALPLSAAVVTPFGIWTMGEISLGDVVSTPDGGMARVIGVYDQGPRPIYKLTFDDGAIARCDEEHLWYVYTDDNHCADQRWPHQDQAIRGRVVTARELATMVAKARERRPGETSNNRPRVPLTEPVQFFGETPRLDPYRFGILLAGGCFRNGDPGFSSNDPDVITAMRAWFDPDAIHQRDGSSWRIADASGALKAELVRLKLTGIDSAHKFIPEPYKRGPIEIRTALLQGLMDNNGTVDETGRCFFDSTSELLARDVAWVARSLGYSVSVTSTNDYRDGNEEVVTGGWRLYLTGPRQIDLFRLTRQRLRCSVTLKHDDCVSTHVIVSIEPDGIEECRCILIDHPAHLFLTDDFIVTHNTQMLCKIALEAARQTHDVTGLPNSVAFFTLEMEERELTQRWIANVARVNMQDEHASPEHLQRVRDAGRLIRTLPNLHVIPSSQAHTLDQILRTMRQYKNNYDINLAIIDYAQLVRVPGRSESSRYDQMAEVAQRVKLAAQELELCIAMGCQLNREGLSRSSAGRPAIHHIADSLDLIRSADVVSMIWRPWNHIAGESMKIWEDKGVILTPKIRHRARPRDIIVRYEPAYTNIEGLPFQMEQELRAELAKLSSDDKRVKTSA